ncbi:MAG: hypothetical protein U9N01_05170, partial [Euryarchaeota archaeon]|nr:hypothetical protein [Euryarchaeota archaeon]
FAVYERGKQLLRNSLLRTRRMSAYQAIYSMGHLLIQLILVAGIIFILPVLSFFVLPATKYSGLAMPLAVVSAILIPEEESIKDQGRVYAQ